MIPPRRVTLPPALLARLLSPLLAMENGRRLRPLLRERDDKVQTTLAEEKIASQLSQRYRIASLRLHSHSHRAHLLALPVHPEPHNSPTNSQAKSSAVCFDFQKGKCSRGANCRYSHSRAPDTSLDQRPAAAMAQQFELLQMGDSQGPNRA